jgi:hypothetical protein
MMERQMKIRFTADGNHPKGKSFRDMRPTYATCETPRGVTLINMNDPKDQQWVSANEMAILAESSAIEVVSA